MSYQILIDVFGQTKCLHFMKEKKDLRSYDVIKEIRKNLLGISYVKVNGRRLTASENILNSLKDFNNIILKLCLNNGGLKGGKGGFGAMLRSQGKGRGKRSIMPMDYGACRDLEGRRLRHINQEIALRTWKENKQNGNNDDNQENKIDIKTPSGIDGWYLNLPSWAENIKKSKVSLKRKTELCKNWLEARNGNVKAPTGAPNWWGCPRGRSCGFAHGEDELRGEKLDEVRKRKEKEKKQKQDEILKKYVEQENKINKSLDSAFLSGWKKRQRKKLNKVETTDKKTREVESLENDNANFHEVIAQSGEISVFPNGEIEGSSKFGTGVLKYCKLYKNKPDEIKNKWYYEVEILTCGLIQIGFASNKFTASSEEGNGVGDDLFSWSFDGLRQLLFHGEEQIYKIDKKCNIDIMPWKIGDIIGCFLDLHLNTISFSINGNYLGIAFKNISNEGIINKTKRRKLDVDKAKDNEISTNEKNNIYYFPAFSLDEGERLRIILDKKYLKYYVTDLESQGYYPIV